MNDKLTCKGITCETQIGYKEAEKGIKQRLVVDYEVEVEPIPKKDTDKLSAIRIDYFAAYVVIKEFVEKNVFHLIETVAEGVAGLLLEEFPVKGVTVSVTKWPFDMPDVQGVTYTCYRQRTA